MPGPDDNMLQQTIEHAPATIQITEEDTLREHLTTLQDWDVPQGRTIEQERQAKAEQLIRRHQLQNEQLAANVRQTLPMGQATATAQGQPRQAQAPARLTYKERKELERREREAQRHNPNADHLSYNAVMALRQARGERDNSFDAQAQERARQAGVDERMLSIYVQGHKTDKRGRPADAEQQRRKAEDMAFLDDYLSNDITRRAPHLRRMTDEVLAIDFTDEMLTHDYIVQNIADLKRLADKLTYFQNIYNDPLNAPFFQALTQDQRDYIDAKVFTTAAQTNTLLVNTMALKGVNLDSGDYHPTRNCAEIARPMDEPYRDFLKQAQAQRAAKENALAQRMLDARLAPYREEQMEGAQEQKRDAEQNENWKGLSFTGYVNAYSFEAMAKQREMIETHPAAYARNQGAVDKLYTELHHSIDALGDLTHEALALQEVFADLSRLGRPRTPEENLVYGLASKQDDELARKTHIYQTQIGQIGYSLSFFLDNKPLLKEVRFTLGELGIGDEAIGAEMQARAEAVPLPATKIGHRGDDDSANELRRLFLEKNANGRPGAVETANATYYRSLGELAGDTTQNPHKSLRTAVYLDLGLRRAGEISKAELAFRGSLFDGYADGMASLFSQLEKNGVDFESLAEMKQTESVQSTTVSHGPGLDSITQNLLEMFCEYAVSDEAVEYFGTLCDMFDGVLYFSSTRDALECVMANLINRVAANVSPLHLNESLFKDAGKAQAVGTSACNQLMQLPNALFLSDAEKQALPAATQQLIQRYDALLTALEPKLEQRRQRVESEEANRAQYQDHLDDLVQWSRDYEKTAPDTWKYKGRVESAIKGKRYGELAEGRGIASELQRQYKRRRSAFEAPFRALLAQGDTAADTTKYIGGNLYTRDVVEFLGVTATDAQIKQAIDDLLLIADEAAAPPQALQQAKQRILGQFEAYYHRIVNLMADSGINTEKPFSCMEEVAYRADKVAELYRFVQVGTYLNAPLAGLVPPEQRAFVGAVCDYIKALTDAASSALSDEKDERASVVNKINSGELTLGYYLDDRMAINLELDEKARA